MAQKDSNETRFYIDWEKTGKNLENIRRSNLKLRQFVCKAHNYNLGNCSGDCDNCRYELDNAISRTELADVFFTSQNVVTSWENGRTPVPLEDMLYYCKITGLDLDNIIVYRK